MRIAQIAPLFEAVIVPHRSLSASGLRRLLVAICLMCSASAGVFVWLGAWPVGGGGPGQSRFSSEAQSGVRAQ